MTKLNLPSRDQCTGTWPNNIKVQRLRADLEQPNCSVPHSPPPVTQPNCSVPYRQLHSQFREVTPQQTLQKRCLASPPAMVERINVRLHPPPPPPPDFSELLVIQSYLLGIKYLLYQTEPPDSVAYSTKPRPIDPSSLHHFPSTIANQVLVVSLDRPRRRYFESSGIPCRF